MYVRDFWKISFIAVQYVCIDRVCVWMMGMSVDSTPHWLRKRLNEVFANDGGRRRSEAEKKKYKNDQRLIRADDMHTYIYIYIK